MIQETQILKNMLSDDIQPKIEVTIDSDTQSEMIKKMKNEGIYITEKRSDPSAYALGVVSGLVVGYAAYRTFLFGYKIAKRTADGIKTVYEKAEQRAAEQQASK